MARLAMLAASALAAALICAVPVVAVSPGEPDASFGTGGEVLFDRERLTEITGIAEQPDGRLVFTGLGAPPTSFREPSGPAPAVVGRLNRDGTLDQSFGSQGIAAVSGFGGVGAPIVQPGGRIVVWAGSSPSRSAVAELVRLHPDGRPDPSFGNGGVARAERAQFGPQGALGLSDGSVVLVGSERLDGTASRGLVARFRPDGSLDTGFGDGGYAAVEVPGAMGFLRSGAEQPGGAIVVAGEFAEPPPGTGPPDYRWTAARLTPDGTQDPTFGDAGLSRDTFDGQGGGFGEVVALPDGRLALAGSVRLPWASDRSGYGVARLDPGGRRDPAFGDAGRAYVEVPIAGAIHAQVPQLATMAEDRLAIAGQHLQLPPSSNTISGWVLGRLDAAGVLDPTFGREGWASTTSGPSWLRPRELLRTRDGKLLLAADAASCDNIRSGLMRFHADEADRAVPGTGPVMRTCNASARQDSKGRFPVEVQCPLVEDECTIFTEVEILRSELRKSGSRAPAIPVGQVRRRLLAGGEVATLTIRARSEARRIIATRRSVRARILFRAVDRVGWTRVTKRSLVLKAPRRKR